MKRSCATCEFFDQRQTPVVKLGSPREGLCRGGHPISQAVIMPDGRVATLTTWPTARTDEWCGDYAPRPNFSAIDERIEKAKEAGRRRAIDEAMDDLVGGAEAEE